MESKLSLSDYAAKLPPEARKRYVEKLMVKGEGLPDPYQLNSGWLLDPLILYRKLQCVKFSRPGNETQSWFTSYVVGGHVKEVKYNPISTSSSCCFLSAKVIHSQRVHDEHHPWVCVEKDSAVVLFGHCTCMAGLDEVCSYVAAVLFKVEIGVKLGLTRQSSTSSACQWNKFFRKEVEPLTISQLQESIGGRQKPVEAIHASGIAELLSMDILKCLYAICPQAAFFTSIPHVCEEQNKQKVVFPPVLSSLIDESKDFTPEELTEKWDSYKCSESACIQLEEMTRSQAVCPLWYEHRRGRITASKAHDVLTIRQSTPPESLVTNVMGYKSYDLSRKKGGEMGNRK